MKLNVIQPGQKESPWYEEGLNFTCTQCGNCCTGGPGFVWITREEIIRLAEFLKLTPELVVEMYCRKIDGRFSLKERRNPRGDLDCIFLTDQPARRGKGLQISQSRRACSVYPARPLQCRTWPFWSENLASSAVWNRSAKKCHGMNQGRAFSLKQIHAIRDAADWPKDPPTSRR